MQVLSNAAQDATAIIGTGLLDALKELGKDSSVDNLASEDAGYSCLHSGCYSRHWCIG
jgi:hypothetical protein